MTSPVLKTTLDNGLTVILKEMHHAPVASFWIWYRVGSRLEQAGLTGASHWVEHLMFRGTPRFPAGELDRLISRHGGHWNAFTWLDFTAYFATLPAERVSLAVELEADRMAHAAMTPDDVEAERTVILSERHMYENQPLFLLNEEVHAAAFRVHGYHHEVLGDEADLRSMTREDLWGHYRRFYRPDNAVVVGAGDFDQATMLASIDEHFGRLPAGESPAPRERPEPLQRGERRITVEGPGDTAYLLYCFRAPVATSPDFYPLALLNAALSGGSSLGLFGSPTTNKSSRLYRALVDQELAVSVFGGLAPTVDPYLYSVGAVVRTGRHIDDVEAALAAELERLATRPLSQAELNKALKQARVQLVFAAQSVSGQAQMLGYSEMVAGDHRWSERSLAALTQVTLDDIDRVRERYLRPQLRTVGRYLPQRDGAGAGR